MLYPKVAILIVTYNSEKDIPHLVESLKHTQYSTDRMFVYIADNGSSDSSIQSLYEHIQTLACPSVIIENSLNLGFDAANNALYERAQKECQPEYVILLNPDTVVEPGWLAEFVVCMEHDNTIGAAQSLLVLHNNPKILNSSGNKLSYIGIGYVNDINLPKSIAEKKGIVDIGYASGAAVCYRASVIHITGLFYPDFFYMEDADISWRIRIAGYRIVVCPSSVVRHKYHYSKGAYKMKAIELNRHKLILQNYRGATLVMMLPMMIVFECMVIVASVIQGWWKEKIHNYSEIIHMISIIRTRRKKITHIRKISDRDILKHMAYTIHIPEGDPLILKYVMNPVFATYGWFVRVCLVWW